jgi:hypothetical protein
MRATDSSADGFRGKALSSAGCRAIADVMADGQMERLTRRTREPGGLS